MASVKVLGEDGRVLSRALHESDARTLAARVHENTGEAVTLCWLEDPREDEIVGGIEPRTLAKGEKLEESPVAEKVAGKRFSKPRAARKPAAKKPAAAKPAAKKPAAK